ncbi:TetR/AcrR family transcriptional regulator [soil metagenome]
MAARTTTTPRRRPSQARSRETRERILDAAAHVFAEYGYAAGTTNRIAAAAELSIGSLYQYFPNKDSILVELTRNHLAAGSDRLFARFAAGLPDGLEPKLRVAVDVMLETHADAHRLHQVLFEEAPRPQQLLDDMRVLERNGIDMVAAVLDAEPEVHVADVRLAASMVVTTIESLVHRFIAREPDTLDVAAFRDELVAMLLRYLRG